MNVLFRRTLRAIVRVSPETVRLGVARLPFSRFHRLTSRLMCGEERLDWRGIRVSVNPGEFIGFYTYLFGDFSRQENDRLLDLCGRARVFFDVGANIGMVSLAAARRWPALHVFSFEPDPAIRGAFEANLERNPDLKDRVHLRGDAIGGRDGVLRFQRATRENLGEGRLVGESMAGIGARVIDVPTRTIDSACREIGRCPDVLKIDVEGAELEVLAGMSHLFSTAPPRAILVELHGFHRPASFHDVYRRVQETLCSAGYALQRLDGDRFVPAGDCAAWGSRVHILALHEQGRDEPAAS